MIVPLTPLRCLHRALDLFGSRIGVVSGVTTVFLPAASEAVMYVMMAAVLIVRPRGLLGEEGRF